MLPLNQEFKSERENKEKAEQDRLKLQQQANQQRIAAKKEDIKHKLRHVNRSAFEGKQSKIDKCQQCGKDFSLTRRQHHCRICLNPYCSDCMKKHKVNIDEETITTNEYICAECIRKYAHLIKINNHGGGKNIKNTKKIRKHQGIYQSGPKKGKLKPGFKYSGKKTKTGLSIIVKVNKK